MWVWVWVQGLLAGGGASSERKARLQLWRAHQTHSHAPFTFHPVCSARRTCLRQSIMA